MTAADVACFEDDCTAKKRDNTYEPQLYTYCTMFKQNVNKNQVPAPGLNITCSKESGTAGVDHITTGIFVKDC